MEARSAEPRGDGPNPGQPPAGVCCARIVHFVPGLYTGLVVFFAGVSFLFLCCLIHTLSVSVCGRGCAGSHPCQEQSTHV